MNNNAATTHTVSNRPRKVDLAKLEEAVRIAQQTSIQNAERATGISCGTIRNEMRRLGIARRRVGNYTNQETDRIAVLIVP